MKRRNVMKVIRNYLAKILLFTLMLMLLVGCVPSAVDGGGEEEDGGIDLYGMEYTILQFTSNTLSEGNPMLYVDGTDLAEMALARIAEIESDYNCDITIKYQNKDTDWVSRLRSADASAQHIADIILTGNSDVNYSLLRGGFMHSILDVNDIIGYNSSTFEIYGTPYILESSMYGGELYFVTPYSHPAKQIKSGQFFAVDTNIVSEYAGVDIREVYEQGEWTWSTFEQVVTDCTVKEDGAIKVYGAASTDGDFFEYAFVSNGYTRVAKNADGNYVANLNTANVRGAIDWIRRIKNEFSENVAFVSRADQLTMFEENRAGMIFMTTEYLKNKVAYIKPGFAVVPFPNGTSGTYGQNHGSCGAEGLGIYAQTEDPESIAYIIKAYCQPFAEYPTLQDALSYYDDMFWDKRDIDVLVESEKYVKFSYYTANGCALSNAAATYMDKMSAQQIIEAYSSKLDQVIEEWIIPNNILIDELMGS